jgi:hypothetical protein
MKGEIKLSSLFIALLVFAMVAISVTTFTGEFISNYNMTSENLTEIVGIQAIQNATTDITRTFNSSTVVTDNPYDLPFTLGTGVYKILKLVLFDMIDIYTGFTSTIATYLHIPSIYTSIAIAIIILGIIFLIVSAILKWRT